MNGGGNGHLAGGEPRPVADVDDKLDVVLRGVHRARWWALAAVVPALVVVVVYLVVSGVSRDAQLRAQHAQAVALASAQEQLAAQERAACGLYSSIAGLPVEPVPPVSRPSQAIVSIVAAARGAYAARGCPPPLPPAAASLRRWAAFYRITLPP